jgi:hypothetical protein
MGENTIGGLLVLPVVAETLMGFLMSTIGSGPNGLSNEFPWSPFQTASFILTTTSIPVHTLAWTMAKKTKNNSYFLLDLAPITAFIIVNSFTKQEETAYVPIEDIPNKIISP